MGLRVGARNDEPEVASLNLLALDCNRKGRSALALPLLLCLSQDEAANPYRFRITNIRVYSFEEAIYHCYHYWKESIDDFLSEEFIDWIKKDLRLDYLATRVQALKKLDSLTERLTGFLSLTDYLSRQELVGLRRQLRDWETRLEWERLKERGDNLMTLNHPDKAYSFYKKALTLEENPRLLNNAALSLLQLDRPAEAASLLEKALSGRQGSRHIALNLAEAYIYAHQFEKAEELLLNLGQRESSAHMDYLHGELEFQKGNAIAAADYMKKAVAWEADDHYIYRLADVYMQLKQWDKALDALERSKNRGLNFLIKQGEILASEGKLNEAVACMENGLEKDPKCIELWIGLASYLRMSGQPGRAYEAVNNALNIDPENQRALLEQAKTEKIQGNEKQHHKLIQDILQRFKDRYREVTTH